MNTKTITISIEDIIFATVISNGRKVASLTLSGLSSFGALIARVSGELGRRVCGLVTINLRNFTRGWSESRSMMLGLRKGAMTMG